MGGLAKKIPITCVTLFCAGVAIAGVPPFSGFWSKDAILAAAYEYAPWIYWVGVITAGMTAFYVFRALFLCFFGRYRGAITEPDAHGHHSHPDEHSHGHTHGHGIHESPAVMWIPLAILAVLSLGGGFIDIPKFLAPLFGEPHEGEAWPMYVSVAFGLAGIGVAALFYLASPALPEALAKTFSAPYRWMYSKYYVDELYGNMVVEPVLDGSRELLWQVADVRIIDGAVNGAGKVASFTGNLLRHAQSGYIRSYAAWVVAGSILIIAYMGLRGAF